MRNYFSLAFCVIKVDTSKLLLTDSLIITKTMISSNYLLKNLVFSFTKPSNFDIIYMLINFMTGYSKTENLCNYEIKELAYGIKTRYRQSKVR